MAVLDHLFPPNLSKLGDRSVVVVDREGEMLQPFTASDGRWRLPVAIDDVDPRYLRMLMAYEDKRFDWHFGVDPLAVGRALTQVLTHGHIVSGASTLSMQAARLLEPRPRTFRSKILEMARALQLEWHFNKKQILNIYLSLAPFGGNIEGVRAASLFYFGKEPRLLTDSEAALLVALPQSPERLRPDRHGAAARARRDRVLARLVDIGVLSAKAGIEATQQAVPTLRRPAVRMASHLALRLKGENPAATTISSLIDQTLQRPLELLARRYHSSLEDAATLAILVVENSGRQVRAYIGSGDYFDERRYGQNDMVTAVRSPGSTLKPFIYGLAFDELLLHPETIVVDRPMRFADFAPENFDHFYRGEVTAREALQLSLNLPAVAVLSRLGPQRLFDALQAAGTPLRLPQDVSKPGLPIALGGAGTTLQDLVTLYAGIASGGRVLPLKFTDTDPQTKAVALMSETAAWYLGRILEDSPPPPNAIASRNRDRVVPIAFKTGTSYGYRDA
ncbi:MAG: penicillin-binding protein 1C, partial [Dongiaceae bacterium]